MLQDTQKTNVLFLKYKNILSQEVLSERDIINLKSAISGGKGSIPQEQRAILFIHAGSGKHYIQATQAQKGFSWLLNLYKSPTGKVRKNNPFGAREISILENFAYFLFAGFIDLNAFSDYSLRNLSPYYYVYDKYNNSFGYYMKAGKIVISD